MSTAGVSRGPLRSSGEKQTKPAILLRVRYFYNVQKKFQARKTAIRWHTTSSTKILYSTFCRVERLVKPRNRRTFLPVFCFLVTSSYCLLKNLYISNIHSRIYPKILHLKYFLNLKGTFWVKLLKLKRYLNKIWRRHCKKKKKTNLIEVFSFKKIQSN